MMLCVKNLSLHAIYALCMQQDHYCRVQSLGAVQQTANSTPVGKSVLQQTAPSKAFTNSCCHLETYKGCGCDSGLRSCLAECPAAALACYATAVAGHPPEKLGWQQWRPQ